MHSLKIIRPQKPRLAELVYDQILQALQSGDIKPNERMHQERLAGTLQVSRTPVREALLRLENEGILKTSSHGGFEVLKATPADVRDIYEAREAVEGYCAGYLAENASAAELGKVRDLISVQEAGSYTTSQEYYDSNRIIHRTFVETVRNPYLLAMFDGIWNRSMSMVIFSTMSDGHLRASNKGHEALVDVVESRNPIEARKATRLHIKDGCELQLQAL